MIATIYLTALTLASHVGQGRGHAYGHDYPPVVPEPSTALLMAGAGALLLFYRRNRS